MLYSLQRLLRGEQTERCALHCAVWHSGAAMPHQITLLLLLLHVALMLHSLPAEAVRVRKKVPRTRSCLDLPEEILEQMFGRLSVGVMSAFHHALQLEPRDKLNLTCPTAARDAADGKARLPVNLLSISPWAYRISYDPARYPRYIPEAYCLCQGCLAGPHRMKVIFLYYETV